MRGTAVVSPGFRAVMNFDFFLGEGFVSWYCGAIVILALFWALKLGLASRALHARLRGLNDELRVIKGMEGFVGAFEQYNARAEEVFGLPWTEFVETLVRPAPGSSDPIRNTGEVSRYLNDATIIFPRISFGFYQSVPNLLTGLGILGTFIGLAFGVGAASSGLSSSDPREITSSLQQLLDGASLAFLTSIAGIACSILFVLVDRFFSRRLHLAVDEWVGEIESRLERVTPEGVALQQLEQEKRATKQLERFNSELIFSIEKALDEKIAGRLSPQLERLVEAVEGLRSDRSTDAAQMIEQALDRFTDAMQERTGSQFEEMASIVADLNRTLKNTADGLARSQQDIRTALESVLTAVRTSMDAGANAMTETLQQALSNVTRVIADASQSLAEQMTDSSMAASAELRETVGSATQDLAKTGVEAASQITGSLQGLKAAAESLDRSTRQSEQVLVSMTAFVDRLEMLRDTMESTHRQIAAVAEPVGRAASDIRASSDRTADTLARTSELVGRIDALVNTLEQHQQSVAEAWAQYQNRFEGIDQSLAGVFQQIDEGLSGYCAQVKRFAEELDQTTSKTIQDLAGATGDLNQSIEDLTEHFQKAAR